MATKEEKRIMSVFRRWKVLPGILCLMLVLLLPIYAAAQTIDVEGITIQSDDYPQVWEYIQGRTSNEPLTIRELVEALPLSACSRQPSSEELQGEWVALPEINEEFCKFAGEYYGISMEEAVEALAESPSKISVDSENRIQNLISSLVMQLDNPYVTIRQNEGVYGIYYSESCDILYILDMLCIRSPNPTQNGMDSICLYHVKVSDSEGQSELLTLQATSEPSESLTPQATPEPLETLVFGSYEQDGNLWNGREPLEWIIAARREDGTALLISRSILTVMEKQEAWAWLPGEFVEMAFSVKERQALVAEHPMSSQNRGSCFLLTGEEVYAYLDGMDLRAEGTAYSGKAESRWWLNDADQALTQCYVDQEGNVRLDGYIDTDWNGRHPSAGVRPACWVELSLVSGTEGALSEAAQLYAQPGQVVTFGHYQQNNITVDGEEPIEWIVLDSRDGESLLLSRYVLEQRPLGSKSWDDCSLRHWLRGSFRDSAFSPEESAAIRTMLVANPRMEEDDAPDTAETVFLLSQEEIERYLPNQDDRLTTRSATMVSQGSNSWIPQDSPVAWLTRTMGVFGNICTVSDSGGWLIRDYDQENRNDYQFINGIRPAIWIDLHMLTDEMVYASKQNVGADNEAMTIHALPESARFALTGQVVTLGAMEQGDGLEPLEWLVLDSDGSRSLLLSVKGLQAAKYTSGMFNPGWHGSDVRRLLAGMLADVFSPQELSCILDAVPEDGGTEAEADKLFLLSVDEVERYLPDEASRVCQAINSQKNCEWWLRTMLSDYYNAATVDTSGILRTSVSVADKNTWVRPAMWVDLTQIGLLLQNTPAKEAPLPTDEPKKVEHDPFDDY